MMTEDTICAVSTPHGIGGVAVIRISGPQALDITDSIWKGRSLKEAATHTAHLGMLTDGGEVLDQAVATVFRAPGSFTGENVVELGVHGSLYVQQRLLEVLIAHGCRIAEPGEFTRRAFANGRMDLAQAEAVADVIASSTRASHRLAVNQMRGVYSERLSRLRDALLELCSLLELELDFSEEDVEFASRPRLLDFARKTKDDIGRLRASFSRGNAIKNGIPVAIVGATNAGKSTLLNALVGEDKAIVSDIHGTTRDAIEDTLNIDGTLYRITDTAGLRDTADHIEGIGIRRAIACAKKAMIILWVLDPTSQQPVDEYSLHAVEEMSRTNPDVSIIAVINKTDAAGAENIRATQDRLESLALTSDIIELSAATRQGLQQLTDAVKAAAQTDLICADDVLVTNARHYESLTRAEESVTRTIEGLENNLSGDLVAQDLRDTIRHLQSITGQITDTDILHTIFARFCIGK